MGKSFNTSLPRLKNLGVNFVMKKNGAVPLSKNSKIWTEKE